MVSPGGVVVALVVGEYARSVQQFRPLGRPLVTARRSQRADRPFTALREMASHHPEALQRPAKPRTLFRNRIAEARVQSGAQVLVLLFQPQEPLRLLGTREFRLRLLRQFQ